MTGLTNRQAALLELAGMLEMVEWKVSIAKGMFEHEPTVSDVASADYLRRVGVGLSNLRKWTTEHGWKRESGQEG